MPSHEARFECRLMIATTSRPARPGIAFPVVLSMSRFSPARGSAVAAGSLAFGDGSTTDGGYEHGEFKFSLPLQVSLRERASVDASLVSALDAAQAGGSPVIERLRTAVPFVELANTDDEFMTEHAETILMGSAFEQLLDGDASAYTLGKKSGELFAPFGRVMVDEVLKVRMEIRIDTSKPEIAAAQPTWWAHRKWMEEL